MHCENRRLLRSVVGVNRDRDLFCRVGILRRISRSRLNRRVHEFLLGEGSSDERACH